MNKQLYSSSADEAAFSRNLSFKKRREPVLKRPLDILLSSIMLLLSAPVCILVAKRGGAACTSSPACASNPARSTRSASPLLATESELDRSRVHLNVLRRSRNDPGVCFVEFPLQTLNFEHQLGLRQVRV